MKVIIKDIEGFGNVFGADCFIEQFPELLNGRGIIIEKRNDFYYVVTLTALSGDASSLN